MDISVSISISPNAVQASENSCGISISISTRRTNVFALLVLMLMSCYVAVFTSDKRDDLSTSTSTRQSTVSSAILLNIEESCYREFRQEMVFCACVCPYAYVASVLTCLSLCLSLCLCLCPSENQPLQAPPHDKLSLPSRPPILRTVDGGRQF